jgi:preprotein translocase subunit SecA
VEDILDRARPEENGNGREPGEDAGLDELIQYANHQFEAGLKLDEVQALDRDHLRQAVLRRFDGRYRPELGQAERSLLLEVLDHAWKEHLYYMDHLRQGIGLVGYAQKDPKVEYKREGMKAFDAMWDRIGDQVTAAIFRLEKESPQFVGSLWQISAATHQAAAPAAQEYKQAPPPPSASEGRGPEPGQHVQAVEPIRNRQPKVGRNDPCPCGSGKKYKKCCGEGVV